MPRRHRSAGKCVLGRSEGRTEGWADRCHAQDPPWIVTKKGPVNPPALCLARHGAAPVVRAGARVIHDHGSRPFRRQLVGPRGSAHVRPLTVLTPCCSDHADAHVLRPCMHPRMPRHPPVQQTPTLGMGRLHRPPCQRTSQRNERTRTGTVRTDMSGPTCRTRPTKAAPETDENSNPATVRLYRTGQD